ncbi:conserved protein, unknown function [Hepatocystis sp. ex Piliocolobus tephrosceles]|nr:conserved protein, unknown function [Hepatocystis sp. ex Piliocolobus tephrosceles]
MEKNNSLTKSEKSANQTIENKKTKYDYTFIKKFTFLVAHLIVYIILVGIYFTYNNDTFISCFSLTLSYPIPNTYYSTHDINTIQNKLQNIKNICNYEIIKFFRGQTDVNKYSLRLYNKMANTYIDYIIMFYKVLNSEIFEKETNIYITHYYFWDEWSLHALFFMLTVYIILQDRVLKRTKKNIFHISIVMIIILSFYYQQFVGMCSIKYNSIYEKILQLIIYVYYFFIILNIYEYISQKLNILLIPIKIINKTIKHNCALIVSLLVFLTLMFVKYFTTGYESLNNYLKSLYTFSDDWKHNNEFISKLYFVFAYHFFFIPMIIIASLTMTLKIIHKNSKIFAKISFQNNTFDQIKKYFFAFNEKINNVSEELDKEQIKEGKTEENKNTLNIKLLKAANIFVFFLFLIFFFLKMFLDKNQLAYINTNFNNLLKEPFITETDYEKSYDTLTSSHEYFQFLNSIVINNIMKNKKNIKNKLFELDSNFIDNDIIIYENFFHIFPYHLYAKIDEKSKSTELAIDNPLLSEQPVVSEEKMGLKIYEDMFNNTKKNITDYNTYSILYNIEYDIFVLINTLFSLQQNGQFCKSKLVYVQEQVREYNSIYTSKLIILISLLIITMVYLILVMYILYYVKNKHLFICFFFVCFFIICVFFFTFNFMTFRFTIYNDFIDQIKNKNIFNTYNINKLYNFKLLINNLLSLRDSTFYANCFSYLILIFVLIKFYCFFFCNYFHAFIKYKNYFIFITMSIWIFFFLMSLIGINSISSIRTKLLTFSLLAYNIQINNDDFSVYKNIIKIIFSFFTFYITSIYLVIFLNKYKHVKKNKTLKKKKKEEDLIFFDDNFFFDNHDIVLYFKSVLYIMDKTFEKLSILNEKYKINEAINEQIQWYNQYKYQVDMENKNINIHMNSQAKNELNSNLANKDKKNINEKKKNNNNNIINNLTYNQLENQKDNNKLNDYNVQTDGIYINTPTNNKINNMVLNNYSHHSIDNMKTNSNLIFNKTSNYKLDNDYLINNGVENNKEQLLNQNYDFNKFKNSSDPLDGKTQVRKQTLTQVLTEIPTEVQNVIAVTSHNEGILNKQTHLLLPKEVEMLTKYENMQLFFTKLIQKKYDFGFLFDNTKDKKINSKKMNNSNGIRKKISCLWLPFSLAVNKKKVKGTGPNKTKDKNKEELKKMRKDLQKDLKNIERIKMLLTHILLLKIKIHIIKKNINELKQAKKELKVEYQNKIVYKEHLSNLRTILYQKIKNLEKYILIKNDINCNLVSVIDDSTVYKKKENKCEELNNCRTEKIHKQNRKQNGKQNGRQNRKLKKGGKKKTHGRGVFGKPVLQYTDEE